MDSGTITLNNLGVIAAISENDKINTKEDYFTIYMPTTFRGLARLVYYGEGREHNVQKISQCVQDAKKYILASMSEIHADAADVDSSFLRRLATNSKQQTCLRMIESLEKSKRGMSALKVTYKDDASCTSKLDCLINEIQDFLATTRDVVSESNSLRLQ